MYPDKVIQQTHPTHPLPSRTRQCMYFDEGYIAVNVPSHVIGGLLFFLLLLLLQI